MKMTDNSEMRLFFHLTNSVLILGTLEERPIEKLYKKDHYGIAIFRCGVMKD